MLAEVDAASGCFRMSSFGRVETDEAFPSKIF